MADPNLFFKTIVSNWKLKLKVKISYILDCILTYVSVDSDPAEIIHRLVNKQYYFYLLNYLLCKP